MDTVSTPFPTPGQTVGPFFGQALPYDGGPELVPEGSPDSIRLHGLVLDGKYTIFGQVTQGMENIDAIKKGDQARNGAVQNPDRIVKMQVAADADKKS